MAPELDSATTVSSDSHTEDNVGTIVAEFPWNDKSGLEISGNFWKFPFPWKFPEIEH